MTASNALAQKGVECRFWEKPYSRAFALSGGYKLNLTHLQPAKESDCRAVVLSPTGKTVFESQEWDISLVVKDVDINGDGQPDLVLKGYSGGAHCCWTYWIISPAKRPALRKKIENARGIVFQKADRKGTFLWVTYDGRFDYFDGLCHACTVFPAVYLRMEGDSITDVSTQYRLRYDEDIQNARSDLTRAPLEKFIAASNEEQTRAAGDNVKALVLTIVLDYLYSGREQQAWKALDEMWPRFDRARIKTLILKTRAEGLSRYVDKKPS